MEETALPPPPLSKPTDSIQPAGKGSNSKFYTVFAFVLAGAMLAAALTFFYLYIRQRGTVTSLQNENGSLQDELDAAEADAEDIEALQAQLTDLQADLDAATAENTANEETLAKIAAYNDLMDYVFQLFGVHITGGTPFTQSEYNQISALAEETGSQELQDAIDDAWNTNDIPTAMEVVLVMDIITEDIAALTS